MPYYFEKIAPVLDIIYEKIEQAIYQPVADLAVQAWVTREPILFEQRIQGEGRPLQIGQPWGELFDCAWMRLTGQIPTSAAGKKVVLLIDVNGEALLVDVHGEPRLGLTTVNSTYDMSLGKPGKHVVEYLESAQGGETVDVWIDAAANDLFGRLQGQGTMRQAQIAICNPEMHQLWHDFFVLQRFFASGSGPLHNTLWCRGRIYPAHLINLSL